MLLALVLATHDTYGIVNSTILFVSSIWFKQGATWLFDHVMSVLASHDTDGIISSTVAFVSSRWPVRYNIHFPIIWHCWHWHQQPVIPKAVSIAPLYSLGQDNWTNVQHNLFVHVMALMLVSYDADSVISGTIPFVRSIWSKEIQHAFFVRWWHWHQH